MSHSLKRGDRVLYKPRNAAEVGITDKDLIGTVCEIDPVKGEVTLNVYAPVGSRWIEHVTEGEGPGQWKRLD